MGASFADRLHEAVRRRGTPALVGIDPRIEQLPPGWVGPGTLRDCAHAAELLRRFGREVLDVVAQLAPAVKFQAAFYERYGAAGMAALADSAERARQLGMIVILDGKRNDIGSTAEAYAEAYLGDAGAGEPWATDAVTVNPYLGWDGIDPFLRRAVRHGKGLFALVRTSNPSAGDFQDLVCDGRPLYRHVAERLAAWNEPHRAAGGYGPLGAVVGATYPEQLAELRAILPGVVLLVPGYGSQGGTARDVAAAFDGDGLGALVNNSRGIIFAYERPEYRDRFAGNWQAAVEQALRDMIDRLAADTPAGKLRT